MNRTEFTKIVSLMNADESKRKQERKEFVKSLSEIKTDNGEPFFSKKFLQKIYL